jgi:hypothetical protein
MSNSTSVRSDKVCVVVGVGEGLGAALAQRFAAGYKVALIARSAEVIAKVGSEIKDAGGVALPIQSDATVESQIASAHEQINRELGPVEILMIRRLRPYLQAMPPAFRDLLKLSLILSQQTDRASTAVSDGHHAALLSESELLRIVRERLTLGGNRRIASLLKEWTDYNAVRVNLPERCLERFPHIARELFKGNYHRFAHGFGSALRDLRRSARRSAPSQDA